ncbi:hypothetical protein BESB_019380 [Besnoitia besnoiti]|uniref:C3H1-type domain-containing protein n=1 Tax=Besnoitia besnoiti TaxID=94643 RepID=A0A2A9M8N8_BESBE|nr:hypothetical protein BESB_019380 [Besnoitia besnoiti]PFH31997.1 hypothetical protein BESB_019380 [Besnoitia besnoiti]
MASPGLSHSGVPVPRGSATPQLDGRSSTAFPESRCSSETLSSLGLETTPGGELRQAPPSGIVGVTSPVCGVSHSPPPQASFPGSSPIPSFRGAPSRTLKKRHSAGDYLTGVAAAAVEAAAAAALVGGGGAPGSLTGGSPGGGVLFWGKTDAEEGSCRFANELGNTAESLLFPSLAQRQPAGGDGTMKAFDNNPEWMPLLRAGLQNAMDTDARIHTRAMREDQKAALRALLTLKQHALQAQLQQVEKLVAPLYHGGNTTINASYLLTLFPDMASLLFPSFPAASTQASISPSQGTASTPSPHPPPGITSPAGPLHSPSPSKPAQSQVPLGVLGMSALRGGPSPAGTSATVATEASQSAYATPKSQRGQSKIEDRLFFTSSGSTVLPNHQPGPNDADCLHSSRKETAEGSTASGVTPEVQHFHRRNATRSRTAPAYTLDNLASLFSLICEDAGGPGSSSAALADAVLREGQSAAGDSAGPPSLSAQNASPLNEAASAQHLVADTAASDAVASLLRETTNRMSTLELRDRRVRFDEEHRDPIFLRHSTRSASLGTSRALGGNALMMSAAATAVAAAVAAAEAAAAGESQGEFLLDQGAAQLTAGERPISHGGVRGVSQASPLSPNSLQSALSSQTSPLLSLSGSTAGSAAPGENWLSGQRGSGGAWDALSGVSRPQSVDRSATSPSYPRTQRRTATLPSTTANAQLQSMDVQCLLHLQGWCKPCAFYYNRKGCRNGANCEFCHHEVHSKLTLKQWKKQQHKLSKQGRAGLGAGDDELAAAAAAAAAAARVGGLKTGAGAAGELMTTSSLGAGSPYCSPPVGGPSPCSSTGALENAVMRTLFGGSDISTSLSALSLVGDTASGATAREDTTEGLDMSPEGTSGPADPTSRIRAALAAAEGTRLSAAAIPPAAPAASADGEGQGSPDGGIERPGRADDEFMTGTSSAIFTDLAGSPCDSGSRSISSGGAASGSPACLTLLRRI